jgi:ribosomal protein L23
VPPKNKKLGKKKKGFHATVSKIEVETKIGNSNSTDTLPPSSFFLLGICT